MPKSKHTEVHMIDAPKQAESGRNVEHLAREAGASKHTLYAWQGEVRQHGAD